MKINTKYTRKNLKCGRMYALTAVLAVMIMLVPSTTFGQINLWDTAQGLPDIDNRAGSILPTAEQLSQVQNLGARADWNQFGTINTLVKDGGFISTGLTGEPVEAAREWIRVNRGLFKLSEQGVANLVLVNDGKMPYNDAHFVLFRQSFGGVVPTQDGQINVSIVNGNIFHVWASSAGDQAAPGAATLTPLQGWLAAASNVNRTVPLANILNVATDDNNNWTLINVQGYPQVQQVRLTAIPTPLGGVRPAYEANVVYNLGHISEAYTVFVDAQSGSILQRRNRVNYLNAPPPPQTTTFQGEYQPQVFPCGGTVNNFTVPAGKTRIAVQATAAVATNDIKIHLLFNGLEVASEDTGTSSEALNYTPAGGVPPGAYQVRICQTTSTMDVPQMAPYSYVGNFVTDDTNTPSAGIPSPRWNYHPAYPDLDFINTDARRLFGCWQVTPGGTVPAACGRDERNTAARAPWDYDFNAGTFTGTTRGNAAQTAESWGSPLTPSTPYAPTSATRDYNFKWTNHWNRSKCDPTILVHTGGVADDADIDASVAQLFVVHNRFHDWAYNLGFTENNYNLQLKNFGNTDAAHENDPEIGNVQAGAVSGGANGMYMGRDNANQIALQDGVPGITNQYLFQPIAGAFYAPCTDGDNDVGIVGHEYTHAISGRMVGGPDAGLSGAQAGAMNESWSDLDAAEFENAFNYVPQQNENKTAVGIYATNNRKLAIRDYNLEENPLNYSNIGFDTPGPEVHADGEIWNAVNWNIRQVLIDKYNSQYPYSDLAARRLCAEGKKNPADCAGNRRWIQMIFDAYLLQQGATSMLDARDAYLAADVVRYNGANQAELWRVFAQRGMGILANTNGTADVAPIPDFSSPLENNATVTFNVLAKDEGNQAIGAKIFVGHYEGRSRPIADTDPATVVSATDPRSNINDNVAKFVPGTYDFIVQAPGYGAQRFTRTFAAGEKATIAFTLPTNRASVTKGAAVITTATVAADQAAKNNLIDDTEDTGARLGTTTTPADDSMTVDLQGTSPVLVTNINVSTAAGPNNPGRFTGIRKFAIDASTNGLTFTTVYTSADDAFPAEVPRPVQPQLIMRNFAIPATMATHLRLRVLKTQCTGKAEFLGEQDNDPFNNTDCASYVPPVSPGPPPTTPIAPGAISRASEFQVFTSVPTISSPAGLEGDVSPRGTADGFVDADDIQQIRRFSVGLDQPFQNNEYQRADDSPRSSAGDGTLDSDDAQQARRYAVGIDSNQFASGPSSPAPAPPPVSETSTVLSAKGKSSIRTRDGATAAPAAFRIDAQNTNAGAMVTVPIRVDTVGNEAGYTFSISYDSTKLTNPMVTIGSGGGDVVFNANNSGQIGFSVTSFSGGTIAAGNNIALVNVKFNVAGNAPAGTTPIAFTDSPAIRKASGTDPNTPITQPTYTGNNITIGGATAATAAFRINNQNTNAGQTLVVPVRVDAVGNEAGYTFSISYDSTKLTNPQVAIGNGGGDVVFNANNPGQIGFSVTSFPGGTIAPGNNIALVNVTFTVAGNAPNGTTLVNFTDTPAPRKASGVDPNTPITQPTYSDGVISIGNATASSAAFRINDQNTSPGQMITVPIRVDALGNEAGYTFSISYDSTKLTNPVVTIGNGGGDVVFNANNPGAIGFSVTSFPSGTIAPGSNIALVNVKFNVAGNAPAGTTPIMFTDSPARRKASPVDPNTPITQPTYMPGTITILGATAAGSKISGRLMTANGRGITNAFVKLTDADGNTRTAVTTGFGYYHFEDVAAGQTYIVEAKSKRYKFGQPTRVLNLNADENDINFIAEQ